MLADLLLFEQLFAQPVDFHWVNLSEIKLSHISKVLDLSVCKRQLVDV